LLGQSMGQRSGAASGGSGPAAARAFGGVAALQPRATGRGAGLAGLAGNDGVRGEHDAAPTRGPVVQCA
jgi:hypothetical protein